MCQKTKIFCVFYNWVIFSSCATASAGMKKKGCVCGLSPGLWFELFPPWHKENPKDLYATDAQNRLKCHSRMNRDRFSIGTHPAAGAQGNPFHRFRSLPPGYPEEWFQSTVSWLSGTHGLGDMRNEKSTPLYVSRSSSSESERLGDMRNEKSTSLYVSRLSSSESERLGDMRNEKSIPILRRV